MSFNQKITVWKNDGVRSILGVADVEYKEDNDNQVPRSLNLLSLKLSEVDCDFPYWNGIIGKNVLFSEIPEHIRTMIEFDGYNDGQDS